MKIEYALESVQAHPHNFVWSFGTKLFHLLDSCENLFIGLTTDPERCAEEHDEAGEYEWERMLVIYQASTREIASSLEQAMITYACSLDSFGRVVNIENRAPGADRFSDTNYLYLLLR